MIEKEAIVGWAQAIASGDYRMAISLLEGLQGSLDATDNPLSPHLQPLLEFTRAWSLRYGEHTPTRTQQAPHCSFCGCGEDAERKLIAGADVFICNVCVKRCANVFAVNG